MRKFLDEIEQTAAKLQDMGEKAVQNAAERMDELRPAIRDGMNKAVDGAKDVFDKAGDDIERAVEKARSALSHAIENLSAADEIPVPPAEEIPEAPEKPLTVQEEIDLDVEAQMAKIRSAQQTPGAFSDYIAQKFGKKQ